MGPPSRLSHWKYGIAVAARETRGVTPGGGGRCTPSTCLVLYVALQHYYIRGLT